MASLNYERARPGAPMRGFRLFALILLMLFGGDDARGSSWHLQHDNGGIVEIIGGDG